MARHTAVVSRLGSRGQIGLTYSRAYRHPGTCLPVPAYPAPPFHTLFGGRRQGDIEPEIDSAESKSTGSGESGGTKQSNASFVSHGTRLASTTILRSSEHRVKALGSETLYRLRELNADIATERKIHKTLVPSLTDDIEGTASKVGILVNKQIEDNIHAFATVIDEKLVDHKKDFKAYTGESAVLMKELKKEIFVKLDLYKEAMDLRLRELHIDLKFLSKDLMTLIEKEIGRLEKEQIEKESKFYVRVTFFLLTATVGIGGITAARFLLPLKQ